MTAAHTLDYRKSRNPFRIAASLIDAAVRAIVAGGTPVESLMLSHSPDEQCVVQLLRPALGYDGGHVVRARVWVDGIPTRGPDDKYTIAIHYDGPPLPPEDTAPTETRGRCVFRIPAVRAPYGFSPLASTARDIRVFDTLWKGFTS